MNRKPKERVADAIRDGLNEVLAHLRGEVELRTWSVQWPEVAPALNARKIVELRKSLGMPQAAFAAVLNVSVKTVQAWEQGLRKPDGATLRLLQILSEHTAVMDAVPAMKYSRRLVNEGAATGREPAIRRRKKVA